MNTDVLKNRDYTLVLDKSGSMSTTDCPSGKSRWTYAQESTQAISREINKFDPDGITVIPFAGSHKVYENTTPETVDRIFSENSPMGGTRLGPVLDAVFSGYLERKTKNTTKPNGEMLIIMTDGQPEDEPEVAKKIIEFTKKLDNGDGEFGISFLQVGKDPGATAFLQRLDDNLEKEGAKFDIVDTKSMEEVENLGLVETLIAALND